MGAVLDDAIGQHDAGLIARHRAGDEKAFEALYNAYYDRLLRFVRRQVREADMVEDITQEAFARAYAAIDKLRDPTRFYPWLSVIARRLVMDHYRLRVRVTAVAELDPGHAEPSDGELIERLTHADVAAALLRVRQRHRDILRMREVEGLSYEAIAERLHVPATTVPPLLWRARIALRREYLAITEEERSWLALPGLYLVFDGMRRVRDRAMQLAAYLPDPQALTGSVAAVAITVGVVFPVAGAASPSNSLGVVSPETFSAQSSSQPVEAISNGSKQDAPGENAGVVPPVTRYRTDLTTDKERTGAAWEHGEGMPYRIRHGDLAISANPDSLRRDLESSLQGDYEWVEG